MASTAQHLDLSILENELDPILTGEYMGNEGYESYEMMSRETDPEVLADFISHRWREHGLNHELLEYWYNMCRLHHPSDPEKYHDCYQAYYTQYQHFVNGEEIEAIAESFDPDVKTAGGHIATAERAMKETAQITRSYADEPVELLPPLKEETSPDELTWDEFDPVPVEQVEPVDTLRMGQDGNALHSLMREHYLYY